MTGKSKQADRRRFSMPNKEIAPREVGFTNRYGLSASRKPHWWKCEPSEEYDDYEPRRGHSEFPAQLVSTYERGATYE